jgi:hypothetical protein
MPSIFWDANAYWSSGEGCPWTFFAYSRKLADADGLPPDEQACQILALLHSRGLRVGPFTNSPVERVAYLACHKDDIASVTALIRELNVLEYFDTRSRELLAADSEGT